MRSGYVASSPHTPTIAISIHTLADYHQTHRVCPSFSIQAEVRKLCYIHQVFILLAHYNILFTRYGRQVPYKASRVDQFSIAYDIYLEVLYEVDRRVNKALGYDIPNWRLLNSCPCCTYRLEDEPELKFSLMVQMDGNNSLKRTKGFIRQSADRVDSRKACTDYWITCSEVDVFKDEVKSRVVHLIW